jgi:3-methyladenine DNA glycosylase/8-oxoguanine DNA glycosylase
MRAAFDAEPVAAVERLASISGIGPWTIQSALLWGIAAADAHPTRDVALLRAARVHYPEVADLEDLDRVAERWKPYRAWAARLLWLDLLGYEGSEVTKSA